ncbi:MAG: CFI-box-CTERM domain-containing protein [Roseovarius sp.]
MKTEDFLSGDFVIHFSRRRLLGTLAATGLTGSALPAVASHDTELCEAETWVGDWTVKISIASRFSSGSNGDFIGYEYKTRALHGPSGLVLSMTTGSTDALEQQYFADGSAANVDIPTYHYVSLFTPEYQGRTPMEVRTFLLAINADTGDESSIVQLFEPRDICEEASGDDTADDYAKQNGRLDCVPYEEPDKWPRLSSSDPSTRGWEKTTVSHHDQAYGVAKILLSAQTVWLRLGYRDFDAGQWRTLGQYELDTTGLYRGIEELAEQAVARLEQDGRGPDTCDDSSCFLTTACCTHMGRPDTCGELQTLRAFRDGWLARQPQGDAVIAEYYRIAPTLCAHIAENPAALRALYWRTIVPCVVAIRLGANGIAFRLYRHMVRNLQRRYGAQVGS